MSLKSTVELKLEPLGVAGKDTVYRCPQCEGVTGSGHLYVNYDKGYWHCFKCNIGGKRIESLLRLLNIDVAFDYSKLYNERDKAIDDILATKKKVSNKIVDYSTDLDTLTQYYLHHVSPLSQVAYDYLINRGMSPYLINKLCIVEGRSRYGEKILIKGREYIGRDYSGRIMVPSLRQDGKISFYVARDYTGTKTPKYLNPPKELAVASEDVWNLDMVDSESVIICEGVFTAISSSPIKLNAVATYGKSIAQKSSAEGLNVTSQGEKLLNKRFKNYYVCYDADAHEESIKTCKYLHDRGANVYMVTIDPKIYGEKADVADIGYEEFLKLLSQATKYDGGLGSLRL